MGSIIQLYDKMGSDGSSASIVKLNGPGPVIISPLTISMVGAAVPLTTFSVAVVLVAPPGYTASTDKVKPELPMVPVDIAADVVVVVRLCVPFA